MITLGIRISNGTAVAFCDLNGEARPEDLQMLATLAPTLEKNGALYAVVVAKLKKSEKEQ